MDFARCGFGIEFPVRSREREREQQWLRPRQQNLCKYCQCNWSAYSFMDVNKELRVPLLLLFELYSGGGGNYEMFFGTEIRV